eukprot:4691560-Prymnesium_polylepis.1
MLSQGGIFRTDRLLTDFLDLFAPVSPELLANKRSRWSENLDAAGPLRARFGICSPTHHSPFPPTYFYYHQPIFDRLQSSYDYVIFEQGLMRNSQFHCVSDFIQLGGDGLSYMRLIHRLAQDPRQYLETKPIVIPRL